MCDTCEANPLILLHFLSLRRGVCVRIAGARFGTDLRERTDDGLSDPKLNHFKSLRKQLGGVVPCVRVCAIRRNF